MFEQYSLVQALLERRSRRFARGLHLNGGPLAYQSSAAPQALSLEEEAALAFAACGVTGYALAELPYDTGSAPGAGGGNIITHLVGRTVPSGDGIHTNAIFVLNDQGAWLLKRPQDFTPPEIPAILQAARSRQWVTLYEKSRLQVAGQRPETPRQVPFTPSFNQWAANRPGTTYFLPVAELSALYINVLLAAFSDEAAYFILDERNGFRPAGIARFARSKGGYLYDRPADGRVGTLGYLDDWMYEFAAIEQGAILQNLALMAEALHLGGFAHFAAHPFAWFQALGFRMENPPLSHTIGANRLLRSLLQIVGQDIPVPTAVGFEMQGQALLKPFCPPYYRNMEEAVRAYIDYKFAAPRGTLNNAGSLTPWKEGAQVQSAIPRPSERAIDATIACCEYVYRRYGRLPGGSGPFRCVLAYQAHHLDADFYPRFYRSEAYAKG